MQLAPILSYFQDIDALQIYWQIGLMAAAVAVSALWLHSGIAASPTVQPHRKRLVVGLLVSGLGISLAIAPYFSFAQAARTQFFAAPIQAMTWALVVEFVASWLVQYWRQVWRVGALSVLVASAVAATQRYQQAQTSTSFEKIVCIFDQVHHLAPVIVPNTLVLLDLNEDQSPFGGRNYQLIVLSRLALGVDAYQANVTDVYGRRTTFHATGVALPPDPHEPRCRVEHYDYSQVIAFDVAADGRTTLLESLPQELLPAGVFAEDYAPRTRIQPGQPSRLRFLRYSDWMMRSPYC